MAYKKELLEKAKIYGFTEADLEEFKKEIPGFTEEEVEAALDEMLEEDALSRTPRTPNDGDELIMHGVPMVWYKKHWIEKSLINDLLKATDGTYWALCRGDVPLKLWEDYPEQNIEIELYGTDLESCIYSVRKFRENFDYRLEAWKYAEKDEDKYLANGVFIDDLIYDQRERWLEILDLERRLLELKREKDGIAVSLSKEDIEAMRNFLNRDKWRLSTDDCVPILVYNRHPRLSIEIPLFGTTIDDCICDISRYYDNFNIDRNTRGCLVENFCLYVDEKSDEAKKYRIQLYDFYFDCFILIDQLWTFSYNIENANAEA